VNLVMNRVSESVDCRLVGEFIDDADTNPAEVAGKEGTPSEGVGPRMVAEFVDQAPSIEQRPQGAANEAPDPAATAAATALHDRAITLYERMVRQEGRSDLMSDLTRALANKAAAVRALGEQRAPAALSDETIALYGRLVQAESQVELTPDLATAYMNKAAIVRALGDNRGAVNLYDRAITLYESLVQQDGGSNFRAQLARAEDQRSQCTLALQSSLQEPPISTTHSREVTTMPTQATVETVSMPLGGPVLPSIDLMDPREIVLFMLAEASKGNMELKALRSYRAEKELGRGGQGAVFLIQHEENRNQAALKIVLPRVAEKPLSREKFEREIEILKVLNHPNVVRLLNWGVWQGVYFLTSEYCDGGDVTQLMAERGGRLSPNEARPIILQALDGLEYAHQAKGRAKLADGSMVEVLGVVHRDVKPHNLFLCRSGNSWIAKLGDYGLAKAFETAGRSAMTPTGFLGGSLQFMPQHLLADFKYAKPEVDIWAVATILYYMLTGTTPRDFPKEKPKTWLYVVSTTHPRPVRERGVPIPDQLADLIDRALDDRNELHFQSAAEFKAALEEVAWE
jgi:tetratricopeptide (TPR) repeat protein